MLPSDGTLAAQVHLLPVQSSRAVRHKQDDTKRQRQVNMDAHITPNFTGNPQQCGPDTLTNPLLAPSFTSTSPVATPAATWSSLYPTLIVILLGYVAICKALRFRAIRSLQQTMGFADRPSLARMTNDEAQLILKFIIEREFPTLYELSLQFAIFKVSSAVYSSPSSFPLLHIPPFLSPVTRLPRLQNQS